jgi:hypothetical protein
MEGLLWRVSAAPARGHIFEASKEAEEFGVEGGLIVLPMNLQS